MKQLMIAFSIGMMLMAKADTEFLTETVDGMSWAYKIVDGEAYIVGRTTSYKKQIPASYPYYGYTYETVWVHSPTIPSNTCGAVTIPSVLGGAPVVGIGSKAFYGAANVSSITLPYSIKTIDGDYPFSGCSTLREVHVEAIEQFCNGINFAGANANPFSANNEVRLYVNDVPTTELMIPNGVTKIGNYAFYNCRSLTKVALPDGMTSIGYQAFYGCAMLFEVDIPASMEYIGDGAFHRCFRLENVAISRLYFGCIGSDGRFFSGSYALGNFFEVSAIRNLTIGPGVEVIGREFASFTNLASIVLPPGVTNVAADAFANCPRLRAEWMKNIALLASNGVSVDARYKLSEYVEDRAIASVAVDADCAIDEFVLTEGKVFDCAIRIVNAASTAVHITLPEGYIYESFVGAAPLTIPPNSTNILTITRTGAGTFLVARRQLQAIGR